MSSCYEFKDIKFDKGLFDDSVDITYIITCCGNNPDRIKHVIEQLNKFHPTKHVRVLFNKGFKNCHKDLEKPTSEYDLRDALMHVFSDARKYNRILVLEDDFEIDDIINKPRHIHNITKFLDNNDPHVYGLGSVLELINPLYLLATNQNIIFMTASHAVFYNKEYRTDLLEQYNDPKKRKRLPRHIDIIWMNPKYSKYVYYRPLIYQKLSCTDNMQTWPLNKIVNWCHILSSVGADVDAKRTFIILKCISYLVCVLLILLAGKIMISYIK